MISFWIFINDARKDKFIQILVDGKEHFLYIFIVKKNGTQLSDETKKKMSESLKGKHRSDETRKKMSEAKKGLLKNKTWKVIDGKRVWLTREV